MTRRLLVTRRTVALACVAVVCAVGLTAVAGSGAFAAGERQAAARETVPECLSKLRKLVAAVAALDRLADDVKDGKVYLVFDGHYYALDKKTYENLALTQIFVLSGGNSDVKPAEKAGRGPQGWRAPDGQASEEAACYARTRSRADPGAGGALQRPEKWRGSGRERRRLGSVEAHNHARRRKRDA